MVLQPVPLEPRAAPAVALIVAPAAVERERPCRHPSVSRHVGIAFTARRSGCLSLVSGQGSIALASMRIGPGMTGSVASIGLRVRNGRIHKHGSDFAVAPVR